MTNIEQFCYNCAFVDDDDNCCGERFLKYDYCWVSKGTLVIEEEIAM